MDDHDVPFYGQDVIVHPFCLFGVYGSDPMDPDEYLVCTVIGPPKSDSHDLRAMYGNPARVMAFCVDCRINEVIPIANQAP